MSSTPVSIVPATAEHLPAILELMRAGAVGALPAAAPATAPDDPAAFLAAFEAIRAAPETDLFVVLDGALVVATYQLTVLKGLGFGGRPRAMVESVHTRADRRSQGIGAQMMAHAEARARAAGCCLIQLTSNSARVDAHRFYVRLGFEASHVGFRKML
ncbi:GNAT family N-acetyltransferase [Pannonibacter tanglangensis]|uniref:GNAT family N-acetyltransferase n=1 Tax=Pannonibacter tanglangensis TaxID=2750084 RepID=A0ABW9ZIC3_9HYPH|nr:GNAT family N-acetyltransferase [Pannonibacter sp. XCT-34]NBN63793.1 GNAT family N-acetyltransferase [Pannonibacter sp. XCT-34]